MRLPLSLIVRAAEQTPHRRARGWRECATTAAIAKRADPAGAVRRAALARSSRGADEPHAPTSR